MTTALSALTATLDKHRRDLEMEFTFATALDVPLADDLIDEARAVERDLRELGERLLVARETDAANLFTAVGACGVSMIHLSGRLRAAREALTKGRA